MKNNQNDVYLDFPDYVLGSQAKSIEESFQQGLLFSNPDELKHSGFNQHHICKDDESAYDLAYEAVKKVANYLERSDQDIRNTDAIIYSTCLPFNANIGKYKDFEESRDIKHLITYPGSKLQADFEMDKAIVIGIDQQACTSMIGSLRLAKMFLHTEKSMQQILCLTADRFPPGAKYEQSYNLISDGAAAAIISRRESGYRILKVHQITNGAMAFASDDETVGHYFNYSNRLIQECLQQLDLSTIDLDYIIPQNTNKVAWEILCGLLPYDFDQVLMETLSEVGHCISGDNIINLHHLNQKNIFKSGDKILMLMAGFGLNWQCVLLEKV
jgi:3-oxoacyl-[acyl-carrier-protein] synthase-3